MGHGGKREGAGRRKGSLSKCRVEAKQDADPKAFLEASMNDPDRKWSERQDCAKALMPYVYARKVEASLTGNFEVVVTSQVVMVAKD